MIRLFVLEGCTKCKKLKEALDEKGIEYNKVECDDDSTICDDLEDLTGIFQYPMLAHVDDLGSITNVLYITDKYNQVGKLTELAIGVTGLGFYSIDQLISYIIK